MANQEPELKDMYAQPIDFTNNYDRDIFVPTHNRDSKLEQKVAGLQKDSNNPSLISDIAGILHNNKKAYANFVNPGVIARKEADSFLSEATDAKAFYVKKNFDDFIDLVDGKQMLNLAMSLPLYKTDNEDHNRLVDVINEMRVLEEAQKDPSKMGQYVESKLEGIPTWLQESLSYFSGNQEYISSIFNQFAGFAQNKFQRETHSFEIENGRVKSATVNRGRLETAFKDSLDKIWEMHDDETNPEDQNDILDDFINPYYLTLAKTVYSKEENELKKDRDADAVEREEKRYKAHVETYQEAT